MKPSSASKDAQYDRKDAILVYVRMPKCDGPEKNLNLEVSKIQEH